MSNHGPIIDGSLVRLRPVAETDLDFLQALWNDGEVMRHVGFPDGLEMTADKMASWWDGCHRWSATHLIVENRQGEQVGESGWGFDNLPGMLEIKLARPHWGRGYAIDALGALIDHVRNHTAIGQLFVTPHPDNLAAQRLYRRVGFRPALAPPAAKRAGYQYWTLECSGAKLAPTTLLFDWGGVLMRTQDASHRRRWEAELNLPSGGVDRVVFESDAWRQAQLGQITVAACWGAIGASRNLTPDALTQFRQDFWAGDRLNTPLVERIQQWKASGRRTALLSNFTPDLTNLVQQHNLNALFEPVILSAHEGVMKPAAWIYWRALNRLGIHPGEVIFVDDMLVNVEAARNVGLHSIQFYTTAQTIVDIEELLRD